MKKIIIVLVIILIPLVINKSKTEDIIEIPKESIRIRVVANSNSLKDQFEKIRVTENLQKYIKDLLKESNTKEETEKIIKKNLMNIDSNVKNTLNLINSISTYKIKYGNNYFPQKEYKGIIYESGYYESLVITLGKGNGDNWWCVLFPPLCQIEIEDNDMNNIEYKLYITEILSKYK